jgi:Fic family protein
MLPFVPPKLPIQGIDWASHVPLLGRANRALAKYEGVLYGVPNPEVLLSPLTTQEAVLSSRIEGTQASFDEVLKFEAGQEGVSNEKIHDIHEIQNYRKSLRLAERELKAKPFNLNLLLRLHDVLLDSTRGRDKARGSFRTCQNWIGPEECKIEDAFFVPPHPLEVMDLMSNWEKYYHADELDPLVQLAVLHAQFEIIHPFLDGNGRIGRIFVPLFLHEKKVLTRPMFYLSGYLEKNRDSYVMNLRNLGKPGSWDRWISFFLAAIESQAESNATIAREILNLYESLKTQVLGITHSQYAVPLLDQIFERPVFRVSHLATQPGMPSGPMVAVLLRQLRNAGILTVVSAGSGRRSAVLALPALINLCEGRTIV